jgi:hypothetical protein
MASSKLQAVLGQVIMGSNQVWNDFWGFLIHSSGSRVCADNNH